MKSAYLCFCLLVVATACSCVVPTSSVETATAAIAELRTQLDSAVNARNADRVASLFTADAVYLPQDEREVVGRGSLVTVLRESHKQAGPAVVGRRIATEVKVVGDWAFEWGKVESVRADVGGPTSWTDGKYLHVYQRLGTGEWKIARASYNANPTQHTRLAAMLQEIAEQLAATSKAEGCSLCAFLSSVSRCGCFVRFKP